MPKVKDSSFKDKDKDMAHDACHSSNVAAAKHGIRKNRKQFCPETKAVHTAHCCQRAITKKL
jgi:hypothetical protein